MHGVCYGLCRDVPPEPHAITGFVLEVTVSRVGDAGFKAV